MTYSCILKACSFNSFYLYTDIFNIDKETIAEGFSPQKMAEEITKEKGIEKNISENTHKATWQEKSTGIYTHRKLLGFI